MNSSRADFPELELLHLFKRRRAYGAADRMVFELRIIIIIVVIIIVIIVIIIHIRIVIIFLLIEKHRKQQVQL